MAVRASFLFGFLILFLFDFLKLSFLVAIPSLLQAGL